MRTLLWWVLGSALTLTAGEAEHVRRQSPAGPGLCIASALLLQGSGCPTMRATWCRTRYDGAMDGLRITPRITIAEAELEERFIAAAGPGGQNVNKVATAVQLRFDALNSPGLTPPVRARLAVLAGRRMTAEGVLVIAANRFRTQERNRADARERLAELIRQAAVPPAPRLKTRPTLASKTRRLDAKSARAEIKRGRRPPGNGRHAPE